MKRRLFVLIGVLLAASVWATDGPLRPLFSLGGRTDENGYLRISLGTAGVTDSPLTALGNLRGRTDENGYLKVACADCGGGGGGGAPTDATYLTQTANSSLSAEQAIGALSSGIMRVATTTGVVTSLGDILPTANGGTGIAYFTAAGPTAARIYTFPDAAATIARTDAANTFTGHQTIEGVTSTGATGTGNFVFDGTPTLVTPVLGAATATSINGNTLTTGTYTLTGAASKVLTFSNTLTLAGTDSTTMTFPTTSATLARTDAANTFTGVQTMTSPALTTPAIATGAVVTGAAGTSALVLTGATQTSSFPALSATQTWNASGTTFTGALLNITNTASAAASKFLDFQFGGTTQFAIMKGGKVGGDNTPNLLITGNIGDVYVGAYAGLLTVSATSNIVMTSALNARLGPNDITLPSSGTIGFAATTTGAIGSGSDTSFVRGGAAAIQMGADTNGAAISQTLQAANGITGTDKTGGSFTFASGKGTGAGAVSSLLFQTPTVLGSGTTAQSLATRLTLSSAGATFAGGITLLGGATLLTTSSALTDGAGASTGTILNAPSAGNPTKWIGINDNGTTRYIPAW